MVGNHGLFFVLPFEHLCFPISDNRLTFCSILSLQKFKTCLFISHLGFFQPVVKRLFRILQLLISYFSRHQGSLCCCILSLSLDKLSLCITEDLDARRLLVLQT